MRKIACVGYHATGAGVIDDLFREFDNVTQGAYEVECRILQDPDGVSDLEYNIVQNPHRLNSGFSIKRFINLAKRTNRSYKKIFGKQWKKISLSYAKSLANFEYKGYWHGDIWLLNPFFRYYHLFCRAINKILPRKLKKPSYYNYFPWLHTYYAKMTEEDFLKATQNYINALCNELYKDGAEYVLLDQLIPPNNPGRYLRYVDDIKVVVVDRDPRDVYIFQQIIKEHTLPKDPHEFCVVYSDSRKMLEEDIQGKCLYVKFEDLIYEYETTIKKVFEFIDIDEEHHKQKKVYFNPDISMKNTRLWEKYPMYSKEIAIIEEQLKDYLYDYK